MRRENERLVDGAVAQANVTGPVPSTGFAGPARRASHFFAHTGTGDGYSVFPEETAWRTRSS